jgi:peptidoglycan/xylan/chitin deacetylase (PgdA/CDA1 family)
MGHHGAMTDDSTGLAAPAPEFVRRAPPATPWLRRLAAAGLGAADALCGLLTPRWVRETPGLIVFALHALCARRPQVHDAALAPGQSVCVDDLRALLAEVRRHGYEVVAPEQVAAGLPPSGKYAMLTFDDGYFNNTLALPVLEEFDVPAAFFVTSSHVLEGKGFWWDAVSRELAQAGIGRCAAQAELARLKQLPPQEIEAVVQRRFGAAALRPRGDSDRPFTPQELAQFARHPHVRIGNHTADHAILTRCSPDEVRSQIERSQETLRALTGTAPVAIAYPNGNHSPLVVQAARAAGLRVGFTVQAAKNRLGAGPGGAMHLGRFYFHGRPDAAREFEACRGGFVPSRMVHNLRQPA